MILSVRASHLLHREYDGRPELEDRLLHSLAVGWKLHELSADRTAAERDAAQALGFLHDLGYARPETGFHPVDGAQMLMGTEFEDLAPQVAWHSTSRYEAEARGIQIPFPEPQDDFLRAALWVADFTTSPSGITVTVDDRIQEIRERYPATSPVLTALEGAVVDLSAAVGLVAAHCQKKGLFA